MLLRLSKRFKVRCDVKRLVSHEEGFIHFVLLGALLIALGVLIGYAIWAK